MVRRLSLIALAGIFLLPASRLRAQLQCSPMALDFGRKPENQVFTTQARLTNVAPASVTILSVQADCGCLTAEAAMRALAPGESTTLTVQMQSGGIEGEFGHNLTITTSEGPATILPVRMAVYAYANWEVTPSRLIFPPSRRGVSAAMELRLTHVGSPALGVIAIESGSPYVAVALVQSAGNVATYRVTKAANAPAGAVYSDVRISTGDPSAPTIDVPVFAYVTERP